METRRIGKVIVQIEAGLVTQVTVFKSINRAKRGNRGNLLACLAKSPPHEAGCVTVQA